MRPPASTCSRSPYSQPEDGDRPAVLPHVTQTKSEASHELASIPGADAAWIKEMIAALPEG
jgi:hypothetical protein